MSAVHREQLDELLDDLPEENLRALLQVLRRHGRDSGIRRWSEAIGAIGDHDAAEMRNAVAEDCERIDTGSW
jgi:hypothetical protein